MNIRIFPALWRFGAVLAMLFFCTIEAHATEYGVAGVEYTNRSTTETDVKISNGAILYANPENTVKIYALGEVGTKIRIMKGGTILAQSADLLTAGDFFTFDGNSNTGEAFTITLPVGSNLLSTQIISSSGIVIKNYDAIDIFIDKTNPNITASLDSIWDPPGLAWINSELNKLYATVSDTGGSGIDTNVASVQYSLYDKTTARELKSAGDVLSVNSSEINLRPQGGYSTGTFTNGHEYYVEFTISDRAGNRRTAQHHFTADYSNPSIVTSTGNMGNDILILGYYDPNHPNCATSPQCQPGGTLPGYMPYNYVNPASSNVLYTNPTHFAIKLQNDHYSRWNTGSHVTLAHYNQIHYGPSYTYYQEKGHKSIGEANALFGYTAFPWINETGRIFRTTDFTRYAGTTRESWRWRDSAYNRPTGYAYITTAPELNAPPQPAIPPTVSITSPVASPNQNQNSYIPAPHGGQKWNLLDDGNRLIPDFSGTVSASTRDRRVRVDVSSSIGIIGSEITVPAGQTTWTIPNTSNKNVGNTYYYDLYARARYTDETTWGNSYNLRILTDFLRPTFFSTNVTGNTVFRAGGLEFLTVVAKDTPYSQPYENSFGTWRLDYNTSVIRIFNSLDEEVSGVPSASWVSNGDGSYSGRINVSGLPSGHYRAVVHLVDNYQNANLADTNIDFVVDNSSPNGELLKGDGTSLENDDEVANVSEITLRVTDMSGVDTSMGKTALRLYKNVLGTWEQIPVSGISVRNLGGDTYEISSGAYIVEEAQFQIRAVVTDGAGNQSPEIVRTFLAKPSTFSFEENPLKILPNLLQNVLSQTIAEGAIPLLGQYEVTAKWEGDSHLDAIIVFDEGGDAIVLNSGEDFVQIYPSYDFGATGGILNLQIQTPPAKYGVGRLSLIVHSGMGVLGSTIIDTREFGGITNASADERYALDPIGQLLDFRPGEGRGAVVSGPDDEGRIMLNGVLWSEIFGWIHLQPCTDGTPGVNCANDPEIQKTLDPELGCGSEVCIDIVSEHRANLEGYGWSEKGGWIHFGDDDGTGGVYLDEQGYFHGVAWSENFGSFVMGDVMPQYNAILSSLIPNFVPREETDPSEKGSAWARTSWRFPNNTAPTVSLVAPVGTPYQTFNRQPALTFHIEDAEESDVGYNIELYRRLPDLSWERMPLISQAATLTPNTGIENTIHNFSEDLIPGRYQWRVTAFDDKNAYSEPTPWWEIEIQNNAPGVSLTSPANGASVDKHPALSFDVSDANGDKIKWKVQIATDSSFSTLLGQSSPFSGLVSGGSLQYSPVNALPSGVFYWRVIAEDEYGMQNQTPIPFRSMTVQNTVPDISEIRLLDDSSFTIPNGDSTPDATPRISWKTDDIDSTEVTTTIEVHLASDNSLAWSLTVPNHEANITEQRRISPALHSCTAAETDLSSCTYSYRLRSCDGDGACSAYKPDWTFIIQVPNQHGNIGTGRIAPSWPDRMIPPDTISSNNRFAWNETAGWIDLNPIGGGVMVTDDSLQGFAWSDTLGWIRMNCGAFDPETGIVDGLGGAIPEECSVPLTNYDVLNDGLGNLTGKAHIESSRQFLYFDGTTFEDDGGILGSDPINVHISLEEGEKGHFQGRGWADSIGWVAFGWEEIKQDNGTSTPEEAQDIFPITEWPDDEHLSLALNDQKYLVFGAQNALYDKFWIARQYIEGGRSSGRLCDDSENPVAASITLEKMDSEGNSLTILDASDFSLECHNPDDGGVDGKLWMQFTPSGAHKMTETVGLYRISGIITDEDGIQVALPTSSAVPHDFSEEFIAQVVAGSPDFSTATEFTAHDGNGDEITGSVVADNDDYFRLCFELKDEFGNPIIEARKYENATDTLLKNVSFGMTFSECVAQEQADENAPPICDDVLQYTPIAPISYIGGYRQRVFSEENIGNQNLLCVDIASSAPTNDESLSLDHLSATITPASTFTEIGEIGAVESPITLPFSFFPIVSATISNFSEFINDETQHLEISLTNNSNTVDLSNFDWMSYFRTHIGAPGSNDIGLSYFRDITLQDYLMASRDRYQEVSGAIHEPADVNFTGGITSRFVSLLNDITEDPTINDRVFPIIHAGETLDLEVSAIPEFLDSGGEEFPEFLHYFALNLGGKIISFPLGTMMSSTPLADRKIAVAGQTHGENITESAIVNTGDDNSEFIRTGNVYTRQEIRNIMRENYDRITGPVRQQKEETDYNNGEILLQDWNDIQNERDNMNGVRSLQDKKVVWYLHQNDQERLTLVLGDGNPSNGGIHIPDNAGPITLFIEGGNVFIRDNITVGSGSNLGIVVLSGRQNSPKGEEGNIFIDPSVTHLEGVYFADGAMISGKDQNGNNIISEGEILDGFDPQFNEYKLSDFSNQLYILGSIVSQNVIGKSSDGTFPIMRYTPENCDPSLGFGEAGQCENLIIREIMLPEECDSPAEDGSFDSRCNEFIASNADDFHARRLIRTQAAQRYDLLYMRRYRLQKEMEADTDGDGITDAKDCNAFNGAIIPAVTSSDGTACSICQKEDGTTLDGGTPSTCTPKILSYITPSSGKCSEEADWCQASGDSFITEIGDGRYRYLCDTDTDPTTNPNAPCDANGKLRNNKMNASVVIEYDPKIKEITPLGMEVPGSFQMDKKIN